MKIFSDLQHRAVESYVNDLAVKGREGRNHLANLKEVFSRLCHHKLKMNPLKCYFGVITGKFLSHLIIKKRHPSQPS